MKTKTVIVKKTESRNFVTEKIVDKAFLLTQCELLNNKWVDFVNECISTQSKEIANELEYLKLIQFNFDELNEDVEYITANWENDGKVFYDEDINGNAFQFVLNKFYSLENLIVDVYWDEYWEVDEIVFYKK